MSNFASDRSNSAHVRLIVFSMTTLFLLTRAAPKLRAASSSTDFDIVIPCCPHAESDFLTALRLAGLWRSALNAGANMANFRTHIAVGTVASGMMATITATAGLTNSQQAISLVLAGALGSVLPDIDLQESRSSRIMFFFIALFLAFCVVFALVTQYSIVEMWILWVGIFLGVRYFGQMAFHHFAVHRGVFHTIPAGILFGFATAAVFYNLFSDPASIAWLGGAFMFFGYLVHLVLDEIYSVDFNNNRIKRSFGTALKIFDSRYIAASTAMIGVTILMFFVTPPYDTFIDIFTKNDVSGFFHDRLLPEEAWFGLDVKLQKLSLFFEGIRGGTPVVDLMPVGSVPDAAAQPPK